MRQELILVFTTVSLGLNVGLLLLVAYLWARQRVEAKAIEMEVCSTQIEILLLQHMFEAHHGSELRTEIAHELQALRKERKPKRASPEIHVGDVEGYRGPFK